MTATFVIYHNPRCGKSRAALALLQEHGIEPTIIEYLKTPPSAAQLKALLKKLGMKPEQLLRTGEDIYKTKIAGGKLTDSQLIDAMVQDPILMERPIIVKGERAIVGRPPERVAELLK